MPKFAVRRRPVAIAAATAMVAASVAALLVSSVAVPPAGAAVAPGSTLRASVQSQNGAQSEEGGYDNAISADGTAVAFSSWSRLDDLDNDGNTAIYVRDFARNRTVMVSRGQFVRDTGPTIGAPPPSTSSSTPPPPPTGPIVKYGADKLLDLNAARTAGAAQQQTFFDTPPDGSSFDPAISADGRYVAFLTYADNIVPKGPNDWNADVIVCDRDPDGDGNFDETRTLPTGGQTRDYRYIRITQDAQYNIYRSEPKLSADAGRIAWEETVYGEGTDRWVMTTTLKDGVVGTIQRLPDALGFFGLISAHYDPAVSADGNYIVTAADVYMPCDCENNFRYHAILSTDVRAMASLRVDFPGFTTKVDTVVRHPAVSADGTVIAFEAEQYDPNGNYSLYEQPTIYVNRIEYGAPIERLIAESNIESRNNAGAEINGVEPALSADGRYLAFATDALLSHDGVDRQEIDNSCVNPQSDDVGFTGDRSLNLAAPLPPERPNIRTFCQVVVRDRFVDRDRRQAEDTRLPGTLISPGVTRNCTRVLPQDASCAGQHNSYNPTLSADGSRIGFDSAANDIVQGDTNSTEDVFVRRLEPSLNGKAVEFGPVELGQSLVRTAVIEQVGNGPLAIEAVTLAGANAADFTILGQTCQGQTLHQTGTCRVTVEFTPRASGDRGGQLQVRPRGGRVFTVDLLGSGTEKPVPRGAEFLASPSPLDFGSRLLLSNGPESTVTVTNQGGSPLLISSVKPVGPGAPGDYVVSSNTCGSSVPVGGQCRVSVKFSPTAAGDRSAALQFTDNAAGSPHVIGLRGQAGAPTIEINPAVTPPGRVVTVTGKGFPPGKTVTVTFTTAVGSAKVTALADGTFRASLLVFAKAKPENRTVVATVDTATAITANTRLLVVFPTVSPAEFVVRG